MCNDSAFLPKACAEGFDYLLFDPSEAKSLKWNGLQLHEVFDESEESIGVASRQAITKLNMIRKTAHIFFFNRQSELLLQKMPAKSEFFSELLCPSAFGIFGIDEAPAQAALRISSEWLGIGESLYYLGKIKSFSDESKEFAYCFMCVSDQKPKSASGFEPDFYSLKEIEKMNPMWFSPPLKLELKRFLGKMKRELSSQNELRGK